MRNCTHQGLVYPDDVIIFWVEAYSYITWRKTQKL